MELVYKLENIVARWLKALPRLPKTGQKWLADNIWWIALVGVVVAILGIIGLINTIGYALSWMQAVDSLRATYGLVVYNVGWITLAFISLAIIIVATVFAAMAIQPLKAQRHRGWVLLFVDLILSGVVVVLNAITTFNAGGFLTSLIAGALGIAIGAYFLFEVRSYFKAGRIVASSTTDTIPSSQTPKE